MQIERFILETQLSVNRGRYKWNDRSEKPIPFFDSLYRDHGLSSRSNYLKNFFISQSKEKSLVSTTIIGLLRETLCNVNGFDHVCMCVSVEGTVAPQSSVTIWRQELVNQESWYHYNDIYRIVQFLLASNFKRRFFIIEISINFWKDKKIFLIIII